MPNSASDGHYIARREHVMAIQKRNVTLGTKHMLTFFAVSKSIYNDGRRSRICQIRNGFVTKRALTAYDQ
jgi:hypothetical protein